MAETPIQSHAQRDPAGRVRSLLLTGAIIVTTFFTFAGALNMDFVFWDDDINVYDNTHIRGLTTENLSWMFLDVDQALRYKPLSWLTWAIIFQVNGLAPAGYHLANVILHSLNAGLLFLVLSAFVRAADVTMNRRAVTACVLGTLVWALHPLRVEPVAWVTGLPYGQALFFMLLSLLCYLHSARCADRPSRARTFYVLSLITFIVALFTYPIVIGYVAVLFVLDFYPLRRFGSIPLKLSDPRVRSLVVKKIPFVAAGVAFIAANLYGRVHSVENWNFPAATLDQFGLLDRIAQAFYVWANYLWRQWWPLDLFPFYPTLIEFSPGEPAFIGSAAVVLGVSACMWQQRRKRPVLLAVWVSYLGLLVPTLGLTDHPHFAADRYGVVAAICWSVLITAALVCLTAQRLRLLGTATAVALVLVLSCLTLRQIPVWRNTVTLCQHTLAHLERPRLRALFHKRLALFFIKKGEFAEAQREISRLAPLNAGMAASMYSLLAQTLADANRPKDALAVYEQSVLLIPGHLRLRYELALLLANASRIAEAEQHYRELLRLSNSAVPPNLAVVFLDVLANRYAAAGKMEEACSKAAEAVRLAEAHPRSGDLVRLMENLERYCQPSGSQPSAP